MYFYTFIAAKARVMSKQLLTVNVTVWMRTQRGGIITWTWQVSRTTLPDLKVIFISN